MNELHIPAIDCLAAEGWAHRDIAMAFNVSHSNISSILSRKMWKHVPNQGQQLLARANLALAQQRTTKDPYPLFWLLCETIRRNRQQSTPVGERHDRYFMPRSPAGDEEE